MEPRAQQLQWNKEPKSILDIGFNKIIGVINPLRILILEMKRWEEHFCFIYGKVDSQYSSFFHLILDIKLKDAN